MLMRTCNLFDKYRDREITRVEEGKFEAHLAECAGCRAKMALLDNLAFILKQDPSEIPADLSLRIAKKAFQQDKPWESLVIGWLRPGPAFVALAVVCVLFSALWLVPSYQPISAYSEYKMLIDEASDISLDSNISKIQNDTELISWLEQEAISQ